MKTRNIIAISLVLIVLGASAYGYSIYKKIFSPNTAFQVKELFVEIPTGASFVQIKKILEPLISDLNAFQMTAEKSGYTENIRSGRFLLRYGMNNYEIVKALRNNIPVKLTFNNQETLEDFAGRIAQQLEPDSLSLLENFRDSLFLSENNLSQAQALCLYLPNTYEFYWNTTALQFREKMAKEYRKFWNSSRLAQADSLGMTPAQVITLASIVQKETAKIDERARIAGVYINRLRAQMPLQADPTAVFAYKKETSDFNQIIKRVTQKQLNVDSPYNTYRVNGLPPGPITMPDISSIEAVLSYEKHDFMYFCASVERFGYHEFARNFQQHSLNSIKYRRWLEKMGY